MTHRLERPFLTLLALLPLLALAHGITGDVPPFLALLLAFLALFLTPGWLLLRRLPALGPLGLVEALPIAFALGLALFAAEATLAFALGLSYAHLCDLSAGVSLGLACWPVPAAARLRRTWRREWLILLAGVSLALLACHLGGYHPSGSDTWYHIAKLRRMAGMERIAETDVLFRGTPVSPSYGYNAWHLATAALARLSSADAFAAWFCVIPLLVVLQVAAYYAFARALFENDALAFCAAFVFVVFLLLDAQGMSWAAAPVPFFVAYHLLFFPALTLALRAMGDRGPGLRLAAGFVGGSAFAVHAFAPFYVLFAVGGLALMTSIFRRMEDRAVRSLLLVCLCTAAFALPYGLFRSSAYRPVGTYYLAAEADKVLRLTEDLYAVHPRYLRRMPVRIAGFLLFPLALAALKRRRWALYAASGMALPPLIMFNPLLVPPIAERASLTFVSRMLVLFPAVEICAATAFCTILPAAVAWWKRSPRRRWGALLGVAALALLLGAGASWVPEWAKMHRGMATAGFAWGAGLLIAAAVILTARAAASRGWPRGNPFRHPPAPGLSMGLSVALTALVCAVALPPLVRDYTDPQRHLTFGQAVRPGGAMGFLKALPGPAVILADASLSPKIPALTGHYVVATAYSHDPVPDWAERQALTRAVLSAEGPWEEAVAGLRRYGVSYVLAVAGNLPEGPRLDAHPEILRRCYEGEGVIIWRLL